MLDSRIRPLVNPMLDYIGIRLSRLGVTANMITFFGGVLAVLTFVALTQGLFIEALILGTLNRFCDGFDGVIARHQGGTSLGAYLDITFDFLFYALVPLGFAIAMPAENAVAAAVLLTSFIGTSSSFLTHAIFAEKHGITTEVHGKKLIYYVGGLAGGSETILFFIAFCIWPEFFSILAYSFAFLCVLSTIVRVMLAREAFK